MKVEIPAHVAERLVEVEERYGLTPDQALAVCIVAGADELTAGYVERIRGWIEKQAERAWIESDPDNRRLIARKGLDRTIPNAGVVPEDVYDAWLDGYANATDAIRRIEALVAQGHDAGDWIERIGVENMQRRAENGDPDAALSVLDLVPDVPPDPDDELD